MSVLLPIRYITVWAVGRIPPHLTPSLPSLCCVIESEITNEQIAGYCLGESWTQTPS
jgi:hypothetical protein